MGSWTDNLEYTARMTPYVQQLPVDAMVQVGMEKQRRYEEGVQKIQTSIDRIAGLDIMRDVDKNYLQSKLDGLGNRLKFVAAGDFSNFQLTNHVAGMASDVGKDPNIINSVASTARARKELGMMENDRKKGTLDPSNEYVFNKSLNGWLNDENVGSSFNGRYVPHFDIWKFAKETFDAVKPDGMTFDQVYELDKDGKPIVDKNGNLSYSQTMTRIEKEGMFPEKVKETIQQIFSDPRVSQQLDISGQYAYRNMDEIGMRSVISRQKTEMSTNYDNAIRELNIQQTAGKDVKSQIEALQNSQRLSNESYDKYMEAVSTNPDAVRGRLYADDVSSRYTTMFGYVKTKQQIMDNPGWRAMFDAQKELNDQNQWAQKFAWEKKMDVLNYEQKERLALIKASGKAKKEGEEDEGGLIPIGNYTPDVQPPDPNLVVMQQANQYNDAVQKYTSASNDLIWNSMLAGDKKYKEQYDQLLAKGADPKAAIDKIINDDAKASGEDVNAYKTRWLQTATTTYDKMSYQEKLEHSILSDMYSNFRVAKMNFESAKVTNDAIAKEMTAKFGTLAKEIDLSNIKPQQIKYKDKTYDLTPQNIYDLAVYKNWKSSYFKDISNKKLANIIEAEGKSATKRLSEKGLLPVIEAFDNFNSTVYEKTDKNRKLLIGKVESSPLGRIYNTATTPSEFTKDWNQVYEISNIFRDKVFEEALEGKAEIIQQHYNIKPNKTATLFTGVTKDDTKRLMQIANIAAVYENAGNLSPDFKEFKKGINRKDVQINDFATDIRMDANGNPVVEIVLNKEGKRKGGMSVTNDQARLFGVDPTMLYETQETSSLRNFINNNNGQTSANDPGKEETYIGGADYYFDKTQFPLIARQDGYDVRVNFKEFNGNYYPFVYMSDGETSVLRQFKGSPVLQNVVATLKDTLTPAFINQCIAEEKAKILLKQNQ